MLNINTPEHLKLLKVSLDRNEVEEYLQKNRTWNLSKEESLERVNGINKKKLLNREVNNNDSNPICNGHFQLKDLRVVLEDCLLLKRKLDTDNLKPPKKKLKHDQRNGSCDESGSKRCTECLAFFDDNLVTYPGDKIDALCETEIIFNPQLKIDTGNEINYDEEYKPDFKITDFSVYDKMMHLCPFDSGLIEEEREFYLSGVVKPIFDDDPSPEGGLHATKIGPITEWWSAGYDGGSNAIIGISSELADYYLVSPSNLYAPFMKSTRVKTYLSKLVIEFLEDNEDGTYEDLINKIQSTVPPEGYSYFTEESIINNAQFILNQVASYDAVADYDENLLRSTKCLKTLISLSGVTKQERRRPTEVRHKKKIIIKNKPEESKATTTPLVRKVFETIFKDQIAGEHKSESQDRQGSKKKTNKKSSAQAQSDSDYESSDSEADSVENNVVSVPKKRKTRNCDNSACQIIWTSGTILHKGDKIFYNSVKINNEVIKVKDCVVVHPDDPTSSKTLVGKVVSMWENQNNCEKLFHIQWFCHGTDTVLGKTSKKNLLFVIDECETLRLSDVKTKCKVIYKPPPSDWQFLGGNEVEIDENEDVETSFFYNKWYDNSCARFEDVPDGYIENYATSRNFNYCPCCERLDLVKKKEMVYLENQVNESSKYIYFNTAILNDVKYCVGNQIFLFPDAFKFNAKQERLQIKEKKLKKNVDENIYPEYYRKANGGGDGFSIQSPFRIGHIESIYCRSSISSNVVKPAEVRIKIKKMYRPENTHEGVEASYLSDFNLLYWSNEEVEVDFSVVEGKCNLNYCKDSTNTKFYWDSNEHNFYFNKVYNAELKTFEEPPTELKELGSHFKTMSDSENYIQNNGNNFYRLKTMDVFAGCGGLSEGLHQSEVCETKWAIEFEEAAAQAFKSNNPECNVYTENCNKLLKMIMEGERKNSKGQTLPGKGEVEFLCGGPPCQGFSGMNRFTAGQYSQFKNSLIASYLSYCDFYRPKYFLLENVRNFLSYKQNMVFKLSLQCLIEMGYQCTFGVLQAGNYGVPQSRNRAFILAAAPGEKLPLFPEPLHVFRLDKTGTVAVDNITYTLNTKWKTSAPYRYISVRDSLTDLPPIENGAKLPIINYNPKEQSHFQKLMRRTIKENKIYDHICKDMRPLIKARMELIPCEPFSDWRDLPNTEIVLSDGTVTKKLLYRYHEAKHGRSKDGALRGVCPCVEDRVFRKCNPLYRQPQDNTIIPWCLPHTANRHNNWSGLYGRLDLDNHFKTTITNPEPMGKQGKILHPNQHRVISVRECARSQGFPDSYQFYGSILDRHKQIGNAVPPPLARALGLEIKKCVERNVPK